MSKPITTRSGTTLRLEPSGGETVVLADNPAAPADMRDHELGRVVDGSFQPAPFAAFAITPEALRAIADLLEPADAAQELEVARDAGTGRFVTDEYAEANPETTTVESVTRVEP